ncbi:MAG: DUF61 family protein [Candidatus Thorarchaeota archaeon]|nr:DUF61 family protein [Candidatus Thorarchaeota archaeon]
MGSFFERVLEREIDSINDHLPSESVPLAELVDSERPSYKTRDGIDSHFRREEIEFLANETPQQFQTDITLPIVILRRMDLGKGIHTIAGGKATLFLIHRVLGDVDLEWEDLARVRLDNSFARLQVQVIRRRLPTTTCMGIVHSGAHTRKSMQ